VRDEKEVAMASLLLKDLNNPTKGICDTLGVFKAMLYRHIRGE
jgi:hypothetical protein